MPISRILVPVDFSEASSRALRLAVEVGDRFDAAIEVLHVLESPLYTAPEMTVVVTGGPGRSLEEYARQEAERQMKELLQPLMSLAKLRVTQRIEHGAPSAAVTIVEVAVAGGFDVIVMSTHGRTGLEHLLIGSVTEKVIRKAPCAVLVTR